MWGHSHLLPQKDKPYVLKEKAKQLKIKVHAHKCALNFLDFLSSLDFWQTTQENCCLCQPEYLLEFHAQELQVKAVFAIKFVFT